MTAAQTDRDGPGMARQGPRPIALHLTAATTTLLGSLAALPSARLGSLPWHPSLAAAAADLTADLAAADPDRLVTAVGAEVQDRLGALVDGIAAYQCHPYRRDLPDPPIRWQDGSSRLFDFGAATGGQPVLLVPSLVNRYYILDLRQGHSLARWLAGCGFRPLVVDWGTPGPVERRFGLTDYIAGRLAGALDTASALACGPVPVVGYCMGGNLALALALLRDAQVSALALLATPWDFHAALAEQARLFAAAAPVLDGLLAAFGELPVDVLQAFFAMLDPNLAARKFAAFAKLDGDCEAARAFVALEDWLNDGVALAAPVARECLIGWYGENTPATGRWRVADRAIEPGQVRQPTLVAFPKADRIVPPASARALAAALPGAQVLTPKGGHIGMMVGSGAEPGLWQPLADWLRAAADG